MLSRNSNIAANHQNPVQGRKINNTVSLFVATSSHNHSHDQHKKSLEPEEHLEILDTRRPYKPPQPKNKENVDVNLPTKRTLTKTQSTKSISKIKRKTHHLTKSILPQKKNDSARSSLSKRAKSQANLNVRRNNPTVRKSLSPKTFHQPVHKVPKAPLSHRDVKVRKGIETDRQKKKEGPTSTIIKHKKFKKKVHEPNLVLNEESVDVAKQIESMTRHLVKGKNPSKKSLKPEKKVIISQNVSKHRQQETSRDSPELMTIMTQRYKGSKKPTHMDLIQKPKPKDTHPAGKIHRQHIEHIEHTEYVAASIIQRAFRCYIRRKSWCTKLQSVVKIQQWWRQYLRVKHSSELPMLVAESSLVTIKDFDFESGNKRSGRSLKIEIIEDSKEERIKERIKCLLEEVDCNVDSNKHSINKKITFSPFVSKEEVDFPLKRNSTFEEEESWTVVDNLPGLQKVHKEKLIKSFNNQKHLIMKMWEEKLCSPRTQQGKLRDLDERLNKELARFEAGVKEVLRGWNLTKHQMSLDDSCESKDLQLNISLSLEPAPQESKTDSIREISDISVQLSGVKESVEIREREYVHLKFDSSLQGIESYLTSLYDHLILVPGWKEEFMAFMNEERGISIRVLLSNLDYADEEDDNTFRVPLYKHFVDDNSPAVSNERLELFNREYPRLRTNGSISEIGEFEYFHVQAVVDALNQEFYNLRPPQNLNLELPPKISTLHLHQQTVQSMFSLAYDGIYKSGSFLCGFIDDNNQLQEQHLKKIQETRLRQKLSSEMKREMESSSMQQELIETQVSLAEELFLHLFEEVTQELGRLMFMC